MMKRAASLAICIVLVLALCPVVAQGRTLQDYLDAMSPVERDLWQELNDNYSTVETALGTATLYFSVYDWNHSLHGEGVAIELSYGHYSEVDESTFWTWTGWYSLEDQRATLLALREHQTKVYARIAELYPNLVVQGGYSRGYYRYPTIRRDYVSIRHYSWGNYYMNEAGEPVFDYQFHWHPHRDTDDFSLILGT